MLVLAVVSAVVTSVFVYYIPQLKRIEEFRHECTLIRQFSVLSNYPNASAVLQLGGGETLFNPFKVSSCIRVERSGYVVLELFNGTKELYRGVFWIFSLNMTVHNTRIEDVSVVMSEGGLMEGQGGRWIILKPPDLSKVLKVDVNGDVSVTVYNFTSNPGVISGNGFGYVEIGAGDGYVREFRNVTNLTVVVRDRVFGSWWSGYLKLPETGYHSYSLTGKFNVTLKVVNVTVALY